MGRDLYEKHIIISEEQYQQLKDKMLYIKSIYDLELIDFSEMFSIKKEQFFNVFEDKVNSDLDWLLFLKDELEQTKNVNVFEYFNKELKYECDEKLPLTLDEWLKFEDGETFITTKVTEEKVGDIKFYLLTLVRYW